MQEPATMRTGKMGGIFTVLAALVIAGACSAKPPPPRLDVTFDHLDPINLNVITMETRSSYRPPQAPPHVDHRFPIPPEEAMRRWANHRLRSAGVVETSRFTILQASVVEERLPTDTGLLDRVKIEPAVRYTATLEGQLEIFDASGRRLKGASARVSRTRSLKEGLTAEERDRAWIDLTAAVMRDFDAAMTEAIKKYLADWVT